MMTGRWLRYKQRACIFTRARHNIVKPAKQDLTSCHPKTQHTRCMMCCTWPGVSTLATSSYEGVVGDNIGLAAVPVHLIEQLQGKAPLARLLTGAYQGAVSDDVALAAPRDHVLEDLQRCLHLPQKAPSACQLQLYMSLQQPAAHCDTVQGQPAQVALSHVCKHMKHLN